MAENTQNTQQTAVDTSEHVVGTEGDDLIEGGYVDEQGNTVYGDEAADFVNGNAGNDIIETGSGNDLAAGDMVGNEWSLVDGVWVFNADNMSDGAPISREYDDVIVTGEGADVLLGNGGDDQLFAGAGNDIVNAGTGDDSAFGGDGRDIVNLEAGDDFGVGGQGADIVNAGAGNDIVYGDFVGGNMLSDSGGAASFAQYAAADSGWQVSEDNGQSQMTQTLQTDAGTSYSLSFEVAANLAGGASCAKVEVMWNGEVVGEVEVTSGVYEKFEIEVPGVGGEGELTFREVAATDTGPMINSDGPISFYESDVTIGGEDVTVSAFAPGQAKLYQVIDGQLKVFDPSTNAYQDAGDPTGLGLNAIGFNVEDDLIYGIAKKAGVDALGNEVTVPDIVMMDAEGNAYRIGEAPYGDFVGDFDDSGNLWTFQNGLNRVTKVDVDNLDANGDPVVQSFDLPNDFFNGKIYDIAYSASDNAFYAVEAPSSNGGEGAVHRIDLSEVEAGGEPTVTSLPISGTLFEGEMETGMAKGAYGAVFLDGDGNLYYGMNRGDHDFDGSTGAQGAIYGVEMDWDAGTAYAKYMAASQSTGRNDGAVDPRSADAFAEVDTEASLLIRNTELVDPTGGDDILRGGSGDDTIFGGGGDDLIKGGADTDVLSGDHGNDRIFGGDGDDRMFGGEGADKLYGGDGNDELSGGAGDDILHGKDGDDVMSGGEGADKLYGGRGDDVLSGGAGQDFLNGGSGNDDMSGGDESDRLYGGAGDDTLSGDGGSDTLKAGSGDDTVYGGEGDDRIFGGKGNDLLEGGAGNDRIYTGAGDNTAFGGDGNDSVVGYGDDDTAFGGDGNDQMFGRGGADEIYGGAGNDKLIGGSGADTIEGGAGNDHLWGGEWSADGSSDTFIVSAGSGRDMIHDFEADSDVVDLSSYGLEFSDLADLMTDQGWATEIDLSGLAGGQAGDKLVLKAIDPDELDESNFIL